MKNEIKPEFEYVDLVFENCAYVRILPKYITWFRIVDISETLWTNCFHQFIKHKNCKLFEISLKNEVLKLVPRFNEKVTECKKENLLKKHLDVFKDITHVGVKTLTEEFYIGVPWDGDQQLNLLQEVVYNKDEFTIHICPKLKKEKHGKRINKRRNKKSS